MEKKLICIVCPRGCSLNVKASSEDMVTASDVEGHFCSQGAAYAVAECTNPVRVLTTTVRLSGGRQPLAPVKSAGPLPKGLLSDCMAAINACTAKAPLKIGDIIIKNILGTGINIVSTSNISGEEPVWKDNMS